MQRWFDILRLRLRSIFRRDSADGELDRELRFHLEEHVAELMAAGQSPQEARRTAMREFGSVASISDQCRDTRRVNFLAYLTQDLRYAVRGLLAQPMLLAAATTSIALGVGANLAIFGLANSFLLSTPTASRPDRLMHIWTTNGSHAPYVVWKQLNESGVVSGVAGHQIEASVNWRGPEASVPVAPLLVTPNFFDVIGVPTALGRGFSAAEVARDPRVVVISHGFWVRRLGRSESVAGSTLMLNGEPYTVLGVTPAGLRSFPGYGIMPDVWLPISPALVTDLENPRSAHVQVVGRLHEGQDRAAAHAALATVAARISTDLGQPTYAQIRSLTAVGGIEQVRQFKEVAAFVAVLLVVTILVLAIACGNVAGLLLARGTARRREIAVRLALGASRGRLVQQLLTEGLALSIAGAAVGLALVAIAGQILPGLNLPLPLPIQLHLAFDTRLVWFAILLVLLSAILSGLAPAWQTTRAAVMPALKQAMPVYVHRRFTLRNLLVSGQIAVSALLLVTTLLFLRNLTLAHTLSPEFDAKRALVAQLTFVEGRQGTREQPAVEAIVERLASLPGVEAAAIANGVPLTMFTGRTGTELRIEGRDQPVRVDYEDNNVGPDYFRSMGIDLIDGREFGPADRRGAPLAVIVNQEFVRRYFEGRNPVGLHIDLPTDPKPTPAEVIGVVADSKYRTIGEGRVPALYGAYLQGGVERFVHVIIRTTAPPQTMIAPVRDAVMGMDASAAVTVEPMTSTLAFAFLPSRIGAALVGLLGVLGAALAMVGLYGVVAFAVTRRTSEIGLRIALGASPRSVVRLVVSDSALLVGIGLLAGLSLAFLVTPPLSAFLVAELPSRDPLSFTGSAILLVATSLLASWGPARRATHIAPTIALRAE
jgi:putative ABC transport system permease protein